MVEYLQVFDHAGFFAFSDAEKFARAFRGNREKVFPMAQQRKQHDDVEQHKREVLNALVGEQVIHTLGEPNSLHKIQVCRLWKDHYRVNIFIGENNLSARITNSYFVEADSNGNIVASRPRIAKRGEKGSRSFSPVGAGSEPESQGG